MKVCLITPPSPFLLDERVFMSLGILKVGAALRLAGHEVDHLDLSGVKNFEETVSAYIATSAGTRSERSTRTAFAITATSPQMPAAIKIGQLLSRAQFRTIVGGPHPTLVLAAHKQTLPGMAGRAEREMETLHVNFDTIVTGDGELAVLEALKNLPGLLDADDPKSKHWLSSQVFTDSPWPARDLVDVSSYRYQIDGEPALSMISQLGCPFKCAFCAGRASPMLRRIRTRPAQSVVDELVHLHETYGVSGCMFLDDELNVNKLMVELMWRIKAVGDFRGINWKLRGFLKAELFTEEQAAAMYAAGFRQLLIGFEAAHPRILLNIEKCATIEDNTRAMAIARKYGLRVKALMSIGHPGETEESVLAVRDWLLQVTPSDFDVTVITPYPGSPYYDKATQIDKSVWRYAAKNGDELFMDDVDFSKEALYYKGAPGAYVSHVWTRELSQVKIASLRDRVESEVREKLKLPFYPTGTAIQYETSMGQTKLPPHILRSLA